MKKCLEFFWKGNKCFISEFFGRFCQILFNLACMLTAHHEKCFVKVSIDHLFDNLESGKRNYCFEKGLEIVLNFGSKKSVRTLYKWWLLHEKSYQIGFSSHTRTEWSSAASISKVENHQPSPEAFSARSILDSTVSCDVTQRGRLESHISDSSHSIR